MGVHASMFTVRFNEKELKVKAGSNLRKALLEQGESPHNPEATFLNCRGIGSCGTCAIEIKGKVTEMTIIEKVRLKLPPHSLGDGLRLACQVSVIGDIEVKKHPGFWGSTYEDISQKEC